ncbi:MAG: MnhB domain-containing protein [Geminicoccaceae bacterium]
MRSPPITTGGLVLTTTASLALAGLLIVAVLEAGPKADGLGAAVQAELAQSGVSNPVTAVLLNFRAYDTMLELLVMLLALIGTSAIVRPLPAMQPLASPVLPMLLRLITPVIVPFAFYVLWIGAKAPGGAFQAGAVLAGIGIMAAVIARDVFTGGLPLIWLRVLAALGVAVFLGIGLAVIAQTGSFLTYPVAEAKRLIMAIELAATLSICITLMLLFKGGLGGPEGGR